MKICFDLDETICLTPSNRNYAEAKPYTKVVEEINNLYKAGHEISIFTARGGTSGKDYNELNKKQLAEWGVCYHKLIDKGKPSYDLFVDDKAISAKNWREECGIKIVGFVASAFDLLHAGHCLYLQESKKVCDYLIAALHKDPSLERLEKNAPLQSLEERLIQLSSTKYVDEILIYETEKDLEKILEIRRPDVRILGTDAKGKPITGEKYCKQIYFHERKHGWSSSELRNRIKI